MRKFQIFTQVTGDPSLVKLTIVTGLTRAGACRQALGAHREELVDAVGTIAAARTALHVQMVRETPITPAGAPAPKVGDRAIVVPIR